MRLILKALLASVFLISAIPAQETSREQSLRKYDEIRAQMAELEGDILRPSRADLASACEQGLRAIRLLPREKYENALKVRGGGAYYSFARSTHEYGLGSDIELQQGYLSVGFAGADYGFIVDLGDVGLNAIVKSLPAVQFLAHYKPPRGEEAIRSEQHRSRGFEANGSTYKNRVPAVVGHSYALRSINFSRSDVLVVFRIVREDPDGSLVIFWNLLDTYGVREIERTAVVILQ